MKKQLENVLQIIENHLKEEVWKLELPINDLDYKIIKLGIEILKQIDEFDNIKNHKLITSSLLEYIKKEFDIPPNKKMFNEWISINHIRHKVIIDVYNSILNIKQY